MDGETNDIGQGYRGLKVYQLAEDLAVEIIGVTGKYPGSEISGAVSQSRRAAMSIVSNIAEGYCRCSRKDFVRFLRIAYGSCGELEAQMSVAFKVGWISGVDYERIETKMDLVSRWTWRLMESQAKRR